MHWRVGQKKTGELDSMMINEYPITERPNGMRHSNKCFPVYTPEVHAQYHNKRVWSRARDSGLRNP